MTNTARDNPPAGPSADPPNARIAPTADNPHGYPPFNLHFVPTYTNDQLHHYHISGAMLSADKAELKQQMEERKAALELINWDGNT